MAGLVLVVLLANATAASAAASAPAPARWVWPLSPRPEIGQRFDPPDAPWGRGHRGVDLLGSDGQQVRAAGAGVVTYAGLLAGRGVVSVRHGDLRTTYQPVSPDVPVGAHVDAGDVVGSLRADGSHCAPRTCLHWGLLRGDDYLDPLSLLGTGPPRLLPLDVPRTTGVPLTTARWTPFTLPSHWEVPADLAAGSPGVPSQPADSAQPGESSLETESSPTGPPMALPSLAVPSPSPRDPDRQGRRLDARAPEIPTLLTTVMAPAAGALAGAVAAGLLVRRSSTPMSRPPLPPSPPPTPAFGPARRLHLRRRRRPAPVVDLASMRRRSGRAA
ncbi:Peptidase family M23 [Actinopolymorpha singaporensis]|uniref:Peptidase family M23 n=2 Tax=Actinopolymorpha singaporensis TaxID=117157 RepID=A0A1H1Y0K2_9ACTN|nr:Peptidase family M23 [Actinopolymorpha singaporensis]